MSTRTTVITTPTRPPVTDTKPRPERPPQRPRDDAPIPATSARPRGLVPIPAPPEKGFTKFPNWLLHLEVSPLAMFLRGVVLPLWYFRYPTRHPSLEVLQAWCRCSRTAVVTARKELTAAGALRTESGGGFRRRTRYVLLEPSKDASGNSPDAPGATVRNPDSRPGELLSEIQTVDPGTTVRNPDSRPGSYCLKSGHAKEQDRKQKTPRGGRGGSSSSRAEGSAGRGVPSPAPKVVDEVVQTLTGEAPGSDPSLAVMWAAVERLDPETSLNHYEHDWVSGQRQMRAQGGRSVWSDRERTTLRMIYQQRVLEGIEAHEPNHLVYRRGNEMADWQADVRKMLARQRAADAQEAQAKTTDMLDSTRGPRAEGPEGGVRGPAPQEVEATRGGPRAREGDVSRLARGPAQVVRRRDGDDVEHPVPESVEVVPEPAAPRPVRQRLDEPRPLTARERMAADEARAFALDGGAPRLSTKERLARAREQAQREWDEMFPR